MANKQLFTLSSEPVCVWFWGHSYINRLERFCIDNHETHGNLALVPESHLIFYKSRPGGYASQLKGDMKIVRQVDAELVIIDIGSNDIDASSVPPDVLAKQIFADAQELLKKFPQVKVVVILEILFRSMKGKYPLQNKDFTADAHRYNNMMKILVNQQSNREKAPIRFWHHRGLVKDWSSYLSDGVHLNHEGMLKYHKSLRRAVLKFSPLVRSERVSV